MASTAENKKTISSVIEASENEPTPPKLEVVGSFGIAERLLAEQGDVKPYKSWLAVSTNTKKYPDEMVLEFGRWANEHTGGFMVVISDSAPAVYNWAAEHENPQQEHLDRIDLKFLHSDGLDLDWEVFFRGKHIKEFKKLALKRAESLKQLFLKHGVDGEVILWSDLERKILEESKENDVVGMMFFNKEWSNLHAAVDNDQEMNQDVRNVHPELASHIVRRLTAEGRDESFIHSAMQNYTIEEVFLTLLLAKTSWANIKIGPKWERHYDEITLKYLTGEYLASHLIDTGPSNAPFGAVYLEVK